MPKQLLLALAALCTATLCSAQPATLYVDADATGANNGDSWTDAFTDLQTALALAQSQQEIWVAKGTYKPSNTGDRSAAFVLKSNVALLGGFEGDETEASERNTDPTQNDTVLSGDLAGDDADDFTNIADNSYHILDGRGATEAVVDGFKIQGGHADTSGSFNERGAGIVLSVGDSTTLRNLWFYRNKSTFGGAIYSNESTIGVAFCSFTENESNSGGAAYFNRGTARIYSSRFYQNHATVQGGAIFNVRTDTLLFSSILAYNSSNGIAAALTSSSSGSRVQIINCNLIANTAPDPNTTFSQHPGPQNRRNCRRPFRTQLHPAHRPQKPHLIPPHFL